MKSIIKKILFTVSRFFPQCRIYGFKIAFWSLVFPLHHIFKFLKPFFGKRKHKSILIYLYNHYKKIIDNLLISNTTPPSNIEADSTIWVCWWDGEDSMPPLVKMCYKSIIKYSNKHPVKFISKYNYKEYISIPEYIINKLNNGIISITSFSDILRSVLLYEYGGIWMDATILVLKDINLNDFKFFTLKAPSTTASIPLSCFSGLFNPEAKITANEKPNTSRWSSFLLAGYKNSVIFEYIRDIYYAYWMDHNDQIDYMLVDFIIALGYEYIPVMKILIDDVPCSAVEKFRMEKILNKEYSDKLFSKYNDIQFNKLTWKKEFLLNTKNGKQTVYGHLLEI